MNRLSEYKEHLMRASNALGLAFTLILLCGVARAEDRFFDSGGVKIHYTIEGNGEPVLLIHGFTANIQTQWGLPGIIRALADNYQVIAIDNRGHGKSDKPHDPKKYGQEMVEDAVRLLDHLKIKKVHVVGYSMGAMITSKLLATHPDRLLTATLGGSGGLREGRDLTFFNQLAESLEQGRGMGTLIEALTPPDRPKPTKEQLDAINTMLTLMNDTKALAAVARGFKELGVAEDKLKANRVPTLALIGGDDPLKQGVDALNGVMANLSVMVIEDTDHMTAFASPEFVKGLREFLEKHAAKSKDKAAAAVK
jgi:pimeloyl-ACP methyl ester carboxylesterase